MTQTFFSYQLAPVFRWNWSVACFFITYIFIQIYFKTFLKIKIFKYFVSHCNFKWYFLHSFEILFFFCMCVFLSISFFHISQRWISKKFTQKCKCKIGTRWYRIQLFYYTWGSKYLYLLSLYCYLCADLFVSIFWGEQWYFLRYVFQKNKFICFTLPFIFFISLLTFMAVHKFISYWKYETETKNTVKCILFQENPKNIW